MADGPARGAQPSAEPAFPVVAISDRALVRDLIVDFLHHHGFPEAEAGAGTVDLLRLVPREMPALVLVDLGCTAEDPGELLHAVRTHRPLATVVGIGSPMRLAAHASDADGWIELTDAGNRIATVAEAITRPGHRRMSLAASPRVRRHLEVWGSLTHRQRQILSLVGCGATNQKLAGSLGITERTVKAHVAALLDTFKADNRTELARIACLAGLRCPQSSVDA